MEPPDRRVQGAHYTTEKNTLKVIEPLFLDDLRDEFRRLQTRRDSRAVASASDATPIEFQRPGAGFVQLSFRSPAR